ncbi:TonB-dependent receptor [Hahella sp. KA22]|uniref:TonB-dependent receptor n=1 Tax=Hahella sp. KA22 TaxID=1628392 RepID=UPI0019D4498B|nr:TonB-dependent receptor plug domain-containing protein [Hahella sp. KA22]
MKFSPKKLAVTVALTAAGGAHAQTTVLEPMIVTAKPVIEEVEVDMFSSTSAVVTAEQIRDQNAVDLTAALRRTPGVQISRYNPVGAFGGDQGGAVFIRGMGVTRPGSEIKTYIDGLPLYMGLWGHPLLDLLPVNAMQSMTVYKSPQPQINGNNFASIDLHTKRATEEGVHGAMRFSAGKYHTRVQQAELAGSNGDLDFILAQGYATSDGHRKNADGELKNLFGRVGAQLNEHWAASFSGLYVDNESTDPGKEGDPEPDVAPEYNTQAFMLATTLSHEHGDWSGEFSLHHSSGEGNWYHQGGGDGDTLSDFTMSGLRWREQFSPWMDGTLVAGLDYDRVSGEAHFNRDDPTRRAHLDAPTFKLWSPYVGLSHLFMLNDEWMLSPSIGVRYYDHNEFDAQTAPYAGLSLMSDSLTLFVNASQGVNYPGLEAPTLATAIPPLADSWKQLEAEELDHLEAGAKFALTTTTQIDLSVFKDKVKNRYVFAFPPQVSSPQFINFGDYSMRGVELSISQTLPAGWSLFGGLTLLDPDIDNLPYTPERAVTAGLNGQVGPFRLAMDAQHQSEVWALTRKRASGDVNGEKVSGFTVANMRVSYPLSPLGQDGEVFVAVENLFDREYAYRPGYPMPGRWAQIGLSASF